MLHQKIENIHHLRNMQIKLPGEVLADIAVELDSNIKNVKGNLLENLICSIRKFDGIYHSLEDEIALKTISKEVLVHELGHAIDYNGRILNTSSIENNQDFETSYKKEMKNYLAQGGKRYQDSETYIDEKGNESSTYATQDSGEMFAECYTLLMLGENKSKEIITKFFPETLKIVEKHIEHIRSLPQNVRN